jgi:hypothetical protein
MFSSIVKKDTSRRNSRYTRKGSKSKEDENPVKRFVCHRSSKNFPDEYHLERHMKTPHHPCWIPGRLF